MKSRRITAALICLLSFASFFLTQSSVVRAADPLYFDAANSNIWDYFTFNWSADPDAPYDQRWTDDSDAYFEGTGGTVNVSGTINSVNSITFGADGYSLNGGAITLTGNGGNITVNGGSATIESVLTGNVGLTKLGAGTLILSGANNFSGYTSIEAGTLRLAGGDNRLPTDAILSLDINATLDLNNHNQNIAGISGGSTSSIISLGSGTLGIVGAVGSFIPCSIQGTGNLVLTGYHSALFAGTNTYSGTTTINAGASKGSFVLFNKPGALSGYDSPGKVIVNNGGTLTVETGTTGYWKAGDIATLLTNAAFHQGSTLGIRTNSNFSYDNAIGGCQSLWKDGANTLTLSAANDFTGDTRIGGGTLALANTNALQNSTIDNNGGGTLSFGTLTAATFGGLKGSSDLSLTNANSTAVALTVGGNEQSTTFSGKLTGKGSLIKVGSGSLSLTRDNTYSGSTTINEGILQIESGGTLPSTTGVVLANVVGAGLIINAHGQTIQSLDGGGDLGGNVIIGPGGIQVNGGSYAGVISGSGSLSAGWLTLSGANTYLGDTAVAGTLILSGGDNRLPTSTTVNFLPNGFSSSILDINGYNQTIAGIVDNYSSSYPAEIKLGNGTLTVNGDQASNFKGFLSGSGNLVKEGAGTLTVTGNPTTNNLHTGSIIINSGTLNVDSSGHLSENATVVLADVADATLKIENSGQRIASLQGGGPIGGTVDLRYGYGASIDGGNFAGKIIGGTISKGGDAPLVLSGNNGSFGVALYGGELTISGANYLGAITVNGGTLRHSGVNIFDPDPLPTATINNGTFIASGATTLGATTIKSGTLRCESSNNTFCTSVSLSYNYGGLLDLNGCNMTVGSLTGGDASGGNVHLGSGTLTLGAGKATYAGVIGGEGGNLVLDGPAFGSYYQSLTGANTYTGTTTIKSGTLILSGGNNRLSPDSSVVMADNSYAVLDLTDLNQTVASLSGGGPGMGTSMPGGRIALGSSGTLTVGDENDTTFAGSIMKDTSGSPIPGGTLIKQGSGTLTISGNNYLFGTNINEGKIKLIGSGLGAVTLANAAGVALETEGDREIALYGGGNNGGNVVANNGKLWIVRGDFAGAISGNANLVIGPASYIYNPYPELVTTLSGANTYEGSTTINNQATLRLAGGDNRLPAATTLIMGGGGGTFDLGGQTQTIAALQSAPDTSGGIINLSSGTLILNNENDDIFVGTINGEGTLTKQGTGTLTLQAIISNTTINVNQGCLTLIRIHGSNQYSTTDIALANAADVALHIPSNDVAIKTLSGGGENGGNIILGEVGYFTSLTVREGNYAGIITGAGDFRKTGTGTLVLSGQNSYSGFTSILEGTLRLDGGSERLPSGHLTIDFFATLDLNGYSQTIASLSGNGGIKLGSGTCIINQGTMFGVIEGEGNLIKQSSFSLDLSRDNAYTGTTTVLGGTLNVYGSLANNGSDKIFVAADGTDFVATISRKVGIDASYAGFGSTAIGDDALGSTADLIDGTNTGTAKSLSIQWRLRNDDDLAAHLVGDVLNLSGMENDGSQTDQFTLQMSYNVDALPGGADAEAALAETGKIQLVYYNETESLWQNAAQGNIGDSNEVLFMGVGSTNDGLLGHWGIDTLTHTVWAVLDHNSQFAVAVPEPGTLALLIGSLLGLLCLAKRRPG